MFARSNQIRAALLAVIVLAVIAAFSASASAATRMACPQNLYSSCFEQPSVQVLQVTALKKARHKVVKKRGSTQCPPPYVGLRCS